MGGRRDDADRPGSSDRDVILPIEDHLDLHNFRPREVAEVVASYLEAAREAGFSEVRLIHGRGIGSQRRTVRAVLDRRTDVIDYADAPPERGGWGATLVRLRREPGR